MKKDTTEDCYLEFVDGYLTCTFNHEAGDNCLMHRCYVCGAVGYDLCPNPKCKEALLTIE